MADVRALEEHAGFGGLQGFYEHDSSEVGLPMRFGVYLPPQAKQGPCPVLFCLAGLTCNEQTFAIKAGAQQHAARHGIALVTPDTSPRNTGIAEADASWDFGTGAGFYLDARREPYSRHWHMESWLMEELPAVLATRFAVRGDKAGVLGHSMGGHGALTLALRHPGRFLSVSAFAPICAPSEVPWGEKAFSGYLGEDVARWKEHDAAALIAGGARLPQLLVDQGMADPFLASQLKPQRLEQACKSSGQPLFCAAMKATTTATSSLRRSSRTTWRTMRARCARDGTAHHDGARRGAFGDQGEGQRVGATRYRRRVDPDRAAEHVPRRSYFTTSAFSRARSSGCSVPFACRRRRWPSSTL